jgi:hypothetical protein
MKNGVFWDVTPCSSCKKRRFGGIYRLLHQGDKNRSTSSQILVILLMEALRSSETSVLTRATRRNIPKDAILHSIPDTSFSHLRKITRLHMYTVRVRKQIHFRSQCGVQKPPRATLHCVQATRLLHGKYANHWSITAAFMNILSHDFSPLKKYGYEMVTGCKKNIFKVVSEEEHFQGSVWIITPRR